MAEIFITLEEFNDKHGKGGVYRKDEIYPKDYEEVEAARIKVLLGDNKYKRPFIKRLKNDEVKHILDEKKIEYDDKSNRDALIEALKLGGATDGRSNT